MLANSDSIENLQKKKSPGWRHRGRPAAGWRGRRGAWPAAGSPTPRTAWTSSSASSWGRQGPCSRWRPRRGRSGWAGSHWAWPRRRRWASAGRWVAGRREAGERPPHRPGRWPASPPTGLVLKEQNSLGHCGSHFNKTTTMTQQLTRKLWHYLQNTMVWFKKCEVICRKWKLNCLNFLIRSIKFHDGFYRMSAKWLDITLYK